MSDVVLVLNAGSSSLKFSLYAWADESLTRMWRGEFEEIGHATRFTAFDAAGHTLPDEGTVAEVHDQEMALAALLAALERRFPDLPLRAVGHRVVHGGAKHIAPVLLDARVLCELDELIPLAPLHQPHALDAIRALFASHPTLPQIACFDTMFHSSQEPLVTSFALPRAFTEEGIRRYGFHGLSYEYIAQALPAYAGSVADGRVVVAHLGSGASMCAMRERRSVATTMGFSALEGLPMGERCGSLDPGVILYLLMQRKMDAQGVSDLLYRSCGLLGVSGISDDMRELLASSEPHAEEAVALFVYHVARELGSLAAALGGLDALVFTAGIGEHAWQVRRRVCEASAWLGVGLDLGANRANASCISTPESAVSVWVIPTDEQEMIAQHTVRLVVKSLPLPAAGLGPAA